MEKREGVIFRFYCWKFNINYDFYRKHSNHPSSKSFRKSIESLISYQNLVAKIKYRNVGREFKKIIWGLFK